MNLPRYDYYCNKCNKLEEIIHSIKESPKCKCPKCNTIMVREIGIGLCIIADGLGDPIWMKKEDDHRKKVKDPDRATKNRRKHFGSDAGQQRDKPDSKHLVRKGKVLAGQEKEVDKAELIKALAKDEWAVQASRQILKKIKK